MPGTQPISSYFTHSPYGTGTLPAVALVLNPREGGCVYFLRLSGPFKQSFLKIQVSSATPIPTGFYSQKLWGFIYLALKPWAVWSGLGLVLLAPKVSLLTFIHHTGMWDRLCLFQHNCSLSASQGVSSPLHPVPVSPLPLPIWRVVASLNPWLSDFHIVRFSDSSECYLF